MRVALVHDWLTGMRGGEYVLEAIAELYPSAELFTLICSAEKVSPALAKFKTHTSWLQKVPGAEKKYRHFLPLMPGMIESFDFSGFDLIVSSSHCVAKGIRKPQSAVHVSYIHAPMRYMWDRYEDYFGVGRASLAVRMAARMVRGYLQNWDRSVSSESRIDQILCNSAFIAEQIERIYQRKAKVVYPFADFSRFSQPRAPGANYLIVSAFAPYKRVDLAIEVFNQLKLPLLIVGSGQDESRLKGMAGPTISFLGNISNSAIADLYSKCRALIFPGIEDFGITPIEAMASGAPVIAYHEGGVVETVTESTGLFFSSQTAESLSEAVQKMESNPSMFCEEACRNRAREFSRARFQSEFAAAITEALIRA